MKKVTKIFIIILAVSVLLAVGALFVSANTDYTVTYNFGNTTTTQTVEELPAYSAGDYIPYDNGTVRASYIASAVETSGNTMTVTLDSTKAYYYKVVADGETTYHESDDGLHAALSGVEAGKPRVVTLLGDCHIETDSSIGISGGKKLYVDLNGFRLVQAANKTLSGGATIFSLNTDGELYIGSSRPGGEIFQASYAYYIKDKNESTFIRAYSLANVNGGGKLFLGEVTLPDGTVTVGNNLSTYTGMLLLIQGHTTGSTPSVSIKGGNYYRTLTGYMSTFLSLRDAGADPLDSKLDVNIDGANIYLHGGSLLQNEGDEYADKNKTINVNIKNSVIAGESGTYFNGTLRSRTNVYVSDSYLLMTASSDPSIHLGTGCRTVSLAAASSGLRFAKIMDTKTVTVAKNTYSFNYAGGEEIKGDIQLDSDVGVSINKDSFIVTATEQSFTFSYVLADEASSSEITWVSPTGYTVTDVWYNGETPVPSLSLPESDTCTYTYGTITTVDGDKTYTAKVIPNFTVFSNLTLADNMLYNVYIPTDINYIKGVEITRSNGEALVLDAPVTVINGGKEYDKYTFGISAPEAGEAFKLNITLPYSVSDSGSATYVYTSEASVPRYGTKLLNADFSDNNRNLVKRVFAYIKAATAYFGTTPTSTYFSDENLKELEIAEPTVRDGEAADSISTLENIKAFLYAATVNFESQLKLRFYIKDDYDLNGIGNVTVTYNGTTRALTNADIAEDNTLTENNRYFEIALKARTFLNPVTVSIGSESFTYKLDNYIYAINDDATSDLSPEKRAQAQQLAYSLYDYAEAAKYMDGSETPKIDITLNNAPLANYKLVTANGKAEELAAADAFKAAIFNEYGITLDIVESTTDKAIVFRSGDPKAKFDSYIGFEGDNFVIECAYKSFFVDATNSLLNEYFLSRSKSYNFKADFSQAYSYGKILYSDFGAVGDGKADDFTAIADAHDAANAKGYSVYGESGKTYYIKSTNGRKAIVKTNTYWNGANFIIDDTDLNINDVKGSVAYNNVDLSRDEREAAAAIFSVENDYASTSVHSSKLNNLKIYKDTVKKIDTGLGYAALLVVENNLNYQYIRYGGNANDGSRQRELVLVDAEGNIDESTPFLFDYENVSAIYAYRADTKPITIDGGGATFTTKAPTQDICLDVASNGKIAEIYKSIGGRNISVTRSNVTLNDINHTVVETLELKDFNADGENDNTGGHSYSGFFSVSNCTNVVYNKCNPTARKKCVEGTYDISVYQANNVLYKDCVQSNFYEEGTIKRDENGDIIDGLPNTGNCWYIMGSNYVKNITYDGCTLTRFDAHAGCYNATIRNSTVSSIRLIGGGEALIESTKIIGRYATSGAIIQLREDYGSTWNGTITLKECTFDNYASSISTEYNLIQARWSLHDFGYETYLPTVIVENVMLSDKYSSVKRINIFGIANHTTLNSLPIPAMPAADAKEEDKLKQYQAIEDYLASYGISKEIDGTWTDADLEALFAGVESITDFDNPYYQLSSGQTIKNVNPYHAPTNLYVKYKEGTKAAGYTYCTSNDGYADFWSSTTLRYNEEVQPEHTHSFGEWDVTVLPTSETVGTVTRSCDCGNTQTLTLPVLTNRTYVITDNTADVGEPGTGTYTITISDVTISFTAPTPALADPDTNAGGGFESPFEPIS